MSDDVQQMIDDCNSAFDIDQAHGGPGFNAWEREFLESVADQIDEGKTLTEKQLNKLRSLWERI